MNADAEKAVITAKELAEFMGISTRTLARLDQRGVLVAARHKSGRRYYTDEHLLAAIELLNGKSQSNARVRFYKNGANSTCAGVLVPKAWLAELGVDESSPEVCLSFDGRSIHIAPANKK